MTAMFNVDPKIMAFGDKATNTPLVKDVQKKYYWPKNNESKPSDVNRRVAKAIANSPALAPTEDPNYLESVFFEMLEKRLFLPGGRILAGAGTSKRVTLMNCFSGDTKLYTKEYGTVPFTQVLGRSVSVLTAVGWRKAEIKQFGTQPLQEITFKNSNRKTSHNIKVKATPDHRWILNFGETTNLKVGQIVRLGCAQPQSNTSESFVRGFKHGLIFGDGQLHRETLREVSGGYPLGTFHHVLRLCGEKKKYLTYFKEESVSYFNASGDDPVVYIHSEQNFKQLPKTTAPADYIAGFIDGWFAADGHWENGNTQRVISSSNQEAILWAIENAPLGGYLVTGRKVLRKAGTRTNLGVLKNTLEGITIRPAMERSWIVESIKPLVEEEVYCAVVPEIGAFTLAGGIYTGNCYVNETLEDSIDGISRGKRNLLITSAMGGGIGTDFSPLRPFNAVIGDPDSNSRSSGAVSFMDTFNADGKTIRSAGERRAAQMGTISDTHPDLPLFIRAKGDGLKDGTKRLAEFNVSVLVSDAFKAAVEDDEEWLLYFHVQPGFERPPEVEAKDFEDDSGTQQYVYSVWRARELWDLITQYTYEFSDPGVIFIDRVNDLNNLYYCEDIRCTNPCGEQPLPPNGTCNLGAINIANCIREPFTDRAEVDFELLKNVATWGIVFLDNVIDVTAYPLPQQQEEEFNKRRVGLGILGLGTALAELGLRYGSQKSIDVCEKIMKTIALAAYESSITLAEIRGSFPYFEARPFLDAEFISARLPNDLKARIFDSGIRNGVLLTIAPVGTGSIWLGSLSSGLEPDFGHAYERKTRRNNTEEFDTYIEKSYTARFWEFCTDNTFDEATKPDYLSTAYEIDILEHIKVQGILQKWVDASVSKTINIPEDYPYEKFKEVYDQAYLYGCKGCTTYRPSKWRDSILSTPTKPSAPQEIKRPAILDGSTYKIKWPSMTASMYITINYADGKPYEIFFASKDAKSADWMTALTLMISAIFRSGANPSFIVKELKQVVSTHDTAWIGGKFYGSIHARLAEVLEENFISHGLIEGLQINKHPQIEEVTIPTGRLGDLCPVCRAPAYVYQEGCKKCMSCGHSSC